MLPETSKTVPIIATYVGYDESVPVPLTVEVAQIRSHLHGCEYINAVVPSHLASSPRLIASSLGGSSFGGSFGAYFLDS